MKPLRKFLKENPKLDKNALKELERIVEVLGEDELNPRDFSLLYDYAKTFGDVYRLEDEVMKEGEVLSGANGGSYANPRQNILINRRESLAKLRRDLGFTPKSREESKPTKEKATLADLLK